MSCQRRKSHTTTHLTCAWTPCDWNSLVGLNSYLFPSYLTTLWFLCLKWISVISFSFLSNLTLFLCRVNCASLPFLLCHVSVLSCLHDVSFFTVGVGLGETLPGADGVRKPPGPWKVSDLDIVVDPVPPSLPESHPGASTGSDGTSRECTVLHKQRDSTFWTVSHDCSYRILSMHCSIFFLSFKALFCHS